MPHEIDLLALEREVDTICDRFEDAWRRGERPNLADYLPPDGPLRQAVLPELMRLDREGRARAEEGARAELRRDREPQGSGPGDEHVSPGPAQARGVPERLGNFR